MKKTLLLVAVCLVVISSCSPVVTTISLKSNRYEKVAPEKIAIFGRAEDVPGKYKELGLVVANTHLGYPIITSIESMIFLMAQIKPFANHARTKEMDKLLLKASEMGANAIIINNIARVQSGISIAAVAIRTE